MASPFSIPSRSMDGIVLTNPPIESDGETNQLHTARLEFLDDGTTRYFRAALAQPLSMNPFIPNSGTVYVLREPAMSQIIAHFARMVGQLLDRGGYSGQVDLYVALTGAAGAQSASWYGGRGHERYFPGMGVRATVPDDDFREQLRTSVKQMLEEPTAIAAALVGRIARIVRPPELPDPLQLA
jgi:hypothetical protein